MKNNSLLFLLLVFIFGFNTRDATSYDLVIQNVTLIDGTGRAPLVNRFVYVNNGKIVDITDKPLQNASAATIIDGKGKYLLPGFIEAHAHAAATDTDREKRKNYPHSFKTMIHYGITSVVLFSGTTGSYDEMQQLQQDASNGEMTAPRIYYSSPFLTMKNAHPMKTYASPKWVEHQTFYDITDTASIRSIIDDAIREKAIGVKLIVEDGPTPPFIKRLPLATIRKVVAIANEKNFPVYAHVSDWEEAAMCIEAGVKNIVHFSGMEVDWNKAEPLVKKFAAGGGSWITTLMLVKSLIYYRLHPEWLQRPGIKNIYDSAMLASRQYPGMREEGAIILKNWAGSPTISMDALMSPMVRDIMRLQELGVNVVAGTDVGGDNFILPGISLHEEMELMQMGGMKPMEIIKMVTRNGAKMLNILDAYGTLEKNKWADMVLLNANPLDDITNMRRIDQVFKGGVLQPRMQ